MKKFISLLLATMMILGCMLTLSSCFLLKNDPEPELDLEDAQENLEDKDYIVIYQDNEDELPDGVVEQLVAENVESGYTITITVYKDKDLAELAYKAQKLKDEKNEKMLKADDADAVAVRYEPKLDKLEYQKAKHMLENYKRDLDDDEIEKYKKIVDEYENGSSDKVYGHSGNVYWYGSKAAVEDSNG